MKQINISEIPMQRIVGSAIGHGSDTFKFDFSGCNTLDEVINDGHHLVFKNQIPSTAISSLLKALTDGFNERARSIGCEEVTSREVELNVKLVFKPILTEIKQQVRMLSFEHFDEMNEFIGKHLKREDVMSVQSATSFFYLYFWAPENIHYDSTFKEPFERKF